jgi:type VI secretion system protein ImpA
MASPEVIEIAALLQPLSDDSPAGVDVRSDESTHKAYFTLQDARTAARNKERSMVADEAGNFPDMRSEWQPVLEQSQTLLREGGKDLEIAAWLIEALTRLKGFAGLRDGFHLTSALVEQYWEHWLPEPDESAIEDLVMPVAGLNGLDAEGTLIVPIRNVPITAQTSVGTFACWHYQQGVALQQAEAEVRQKRIDAGAVTLENILQAGSESGADYYDTALADLTECQAEYTRLCALLDERCGQQSPPQSNIKNTLASCHEALRYAGKNVIIEEPDEEQLDESGDAQADSGASAATASYPRSREQAFKTLSELSEFFLRNEPHSPISYALKQVVRWGHMSLPDLLEELIAEEGARQNLFRLAGIKKPESPQ